VGKSWDDLEESWTPVTTSVRVTTRNDLALEVQRLSEHLVAARLRDEQHKNELDYTAEAPEIARRMVELQEQIEAEQVEFVFRDVGADTWDRLLAKHPASKSERDAGVHYSAQFQVALLAEACVEPEDATVERFRRLRERHNGQFAQLLDACFNATMGRNDLGKESATAFAILRSIGQGSEAQPE
jgi:hypothetical protein